MPAVAPARARFAVAAIFAVNGALTGVWAANIPRIQERLGLDPQTLSFGFLAMAAGAVVGMPLGGWLIAHLGSARMTMLGGLAFLALLPLPILAPGFAALTIALALFGLANGVMDVAMNAHGVLVEGRLQRPVMSTFHALWSTGGLAGAAVAGFFGNPNAATLTVLGAVAAAFAVFIPACGNLLATELDRQPSASHFALPSRLTLPLGMLAFLGMMSEGAIVDWSGIYLREMKASPELAAAGFAGFSATMAFGRFFGDFLRGRFGAARLVATSAGLGLAGLILALAAPAPLVAVAGFAVMGLGIANIAPVIYGAAGRLKGVAPGVSIASVITMGYTGFLFGPPIIGLVAQHASLQAGLGCLALASLAMLALSPAAAT